MIHKKQPEVSTSTSVRNLLPGITIVLVVIYVVPFLVYSLFTVFTDLTTPQSTSPLLFLTGVLVSKVGVAIAFVLFFYIGRNAFYGEWVLYAFIWWVFFVFNEIGQCIGSNYTWMEALAGVLSETIYFPVSAYIINRQMGTMLDQKHL